MAATALQSKRQKVRARPTSRAKNPSAWECNLTNTQKPAAPAFGARTTSRFGEDRWAGRPGWRGGKAPPRGHGLRKGKHKRGKGNNWTQERRVHRRCNRRRRRKHARRMSLLGLARAMTVPAIFTTDQGACGKVHQGLLRALSRAKRDGDQIAGHLPWGKHVSRGHHRAHKHREQRKR